MDNSSTGNDRSDGNNGNGDTKLDKFNDTVRVPFPVPAIARSARSRHHISVQNELLDKYREQWTKLRLLGTKSPSNNFSSQSVCTQTREQEALCTRLVTDDALEFAWPPAASDSAPASSSSSSAPAPPLRYIGGVDISFIKVDRSRAEHNSPAFTHLLPFRSCRATR